MSLFNIKQKSSFGMNSTNALHVYFVPLGVRAKKTYVSSTTYIIYKARKGHSRTDCDSLTVRGEGERGWGLARTASEGAA